MTDIKTLLLRVTDAIREAVERQGYELKPGSMRMTFPRVGAHVITDVDFRIDWTAQHQAGEFTALQEIGARSPRRLTGGERQS